MMDLTLGRCHATWHVNSRPIAALVWLCGLVLSLSATAQDSVDMARYFPTRPGTTWTMHTVNHLTSGEADLTITLEPPTTWRGYPITPWLFRKTAADGYWGPGVAYDLRWFVMDASVFLDTPNRFFNSFYWVLGHHVLTMGTNTVLQEVAYRSGTTYPPYVLLPRLMQLPCDVLNDAGQGFAIGASVGSVTPYPVWHPQAPLDQWSSWWSKSAFVAEIPGWGTNGGDTQKFLRVDYYEGSTAPYHVRQGGILTNTNLLRESWYFEREVGLVAIRTKQHVDNGSPAYPQDADFSNPDILSPDVEVVRVP